jgi:hypothetical protein
LERRENVGQPHAQCVDLCGQFRRYKISFIHLEENHSVAKIGIRTKKIHELNFSEAAEHQKIFYQSTTVNNFLKRELVLLWNKAKEKFSMHTKFKAPWIKPYFIDKILGFNSYML